jgi:NADH dehydrogenase
MPAHIVIVGGGFGGLYAAQALKDAPVKITLIDRRNHHLFQPLLYQVATGTLNPSDIAYPLREILSKQKNCTVLLAEATGFDVPNRKVKLADGEIEYDYLVLATGATHSYFGNDTWEHYAPGLKTLEDAMEIRKRILYAFEAAERETNMIQRMKWLTFVVVGAGPTGIELAGAVAEFANHTAKHDFRNIDPTSAKVILLEGAPRIALAYTPESSESAKRQLEAMGVEVRCNAKVTFIDDNGVCLDTECIPTSTVLWGAGVKASPLGALLGAPCDRAGRVKVTPFLNVPGHDNIYVVGDLAAAESNGKPVPGVAQGAMQGGAHVAENIMRHIHGETPQAFSYWDKGSMATIGRNAAIAEMKDGKIKMTGFVAWMAWLVVHVLFLMGFRSKLIVLIEWVWGYITWQRGARLITGEIAHVRSHTVKHNPPVLGGDHPAAEAQKQQAVH